MRTAAPPGLAVITRYAAPAPAKTSNGPVTSRLCTPANSRIRTLRPDMPTSLRPGGDGSNAVDPTFSATPLLTAITAAYLGGMTRFSGLDDLLATEHLGTSAWHLVDQARIDAFAQVTGDRQWIHVDPERAARESPFGTTIAHGALTLSLCLTFLTEVLHVDGVAFVVNGGFDRVRFHTLVRAGSRLRGVISLVQARRTSGGARIVVRTRAEIDGDKRPACLADHILGLR